MFPEILFLVELKILSTMIPTDIREYLDLHPLELPADQHRRRAQHSRQNLAVGWILCEEMRVVVTLDGDGHAGATAVARDRAPKARFHTIARRVGLQDEVPGGDVGRQDPPASVARLLPRPERLRPGTVDPHGPRQLDE